MKRCRMCEKQTKEGTFYNHVNEKNGAVEHFRGKRRRLEAHFLAGQCCGCQWWSV